MTPSVPAALTFLGLDPNRRPSKAEVTKQTIGLTAEEYGRKLANDIFNEWLAARAAG
ncbi:MAG: hypothetical protein OXH23_12355 [bacterium]|nr:hypothetical protein [bacterium]